MSASIMAVNGPGPMPAISITRIPLSGPMIVDATKRRTRSYREAIADLTDVTGSADSAHSADIAAAYAAGRARISALVADLDEQRANTIVPCCPEWTVKDVVAHVTGICGDMLAGNLDGLATDPWTAAQVAARRHRPVAEIVAEWGELGPQVEAMIPAVPIEPARMLVGDLATHEHDVRGALSAPGARDSDAVAIGISFIVPNFLAAGAGQGLPPLRVQADDSEWVTDGSRPETSVSADRFELLRAMTGRRSPSQLRQLTWSGDPRTASGRVLVGAVHRGGRRHR